MQLRIGKFEKYLLIFTLVDILFAPYVFFLATTYSQFIVFIWFIIKDKRYFIKKEVQFYYGILFFIFLSTIFSLSTIPSGLIGKYFVENIKRGLNLGMGISYYFFFFYIFQFIEINLKKWFVIFIVYVTAWGILYYLNISYFLLLKSIFNPHDAVLLSMTGKNFFYRFSFIWTDPNNVGYMLIGIIAFLLVDKNTSNVVIMVCILCLIFNLILIMSAGSFIVAIIIIPLGFYFRLKGSASLLKF